jgi:L-ascorbate metabolism protein UlaG (beta-lactamase superfamily)
MEKIKFKDILITVFGHASTMIKAENKIIYIDPFILPENPEKADLIIYTHGHFDHCVDSSNIKKEGTILIGRNCKYQQEDILPGQSFEKLNIKIKAVEAYNLEKPFHKKGESIGVILDINGTKIYHAGDTELILEMNTLGYKCDVALLPCGGKFTMDPDQALEAVKAIKPRLVIPIHYGKEYGVDLPNGKEEVEKLKQKIEELGIRCEIPY